MLSSCLALAKDRMLPYSIQHSSKQRNYKWNEASIATQPGVVVVVLLLDLTAMNSTLTSAMLSTAILFFFLLTSLCRQYYILLLTKWRIRNSSIYRGQYAATWGFGGTVMLHTVDGVVKQKIGCICCLAECCCTIKMYGQYYYIKNTLHIGLLSYGYQ